MIRTIAREVIGTIIVIAISVFVYATPARSLMPSSIEFVNHMRYYSFEQLGEVRSL